MSTAAQVLSTVGLVLSALGVGVLYFWQPRAIMNVVDADGTSNIEVLTGKAKDAPRARYGLCLTVIGSLAQLVAVWV